jgi:hypothetical protein
LLRANGSSECAPDDRLREAIQLLPRKKIAERVRAKRQIVEWIQQIHPTGKSPQKSVKRSRKKYSDFQK